MSSQNPFPQRLPLSSTNLPLTFFSRRLVLIVINGKNAVKYLHGQLTCDVDSLNIDRFSFCLL
ncbi:hypothetical protein [Candidatus Gullanella endobia]|uniref:hypothetical protein n=1 Tax=Candidatus Gullanella endobia TaxID=1070130 RepID=UPI001E5AEF7B|nr:hypothetical protein [Candidatus Gullanella endobia]